MDNNVIYVIVFSYFRAFIGPVGGGYLKDKLQFAMAAVIIGCTLVFSVSLFYKNEDILYIKLTN